MTIRLSLTISAKSPALLQTAGGRRRIEDTGGVPEMRPQADREDVVIRQNPLSMREELESLRGEISPSLFRFLAHVEERITDGELASGFGWVTVDSPSIITQPSGD
jgi:hypothetical protein